MENNGCVSFFLQMLQIFARTTSLQIIQINVPNNALAIFANRVLDTFLQIVIPDNFYAFFFKLAFRTTILQFVIQYNLSFAKCDKCFISFDITFKVWLEAVPGVV